MASQQETKFKVIGTRPIRHDGADKVTGRAQYGADINLAGLLHGKVLRSPHAHAKIKSIDTSAAKAVPGVKAVLTAEDFPEIGPGMAAMGELPVNPQHLSLNCIARDKVLYDGHVVAAVAATSAHIAEEATKLINVEYEVLPHVQSVVAAMDDKAPILIGGLGKDEDGNATDTNVANHIKFERGDLAAGFDAAEVVVEREFDTSMVHQGYIEPHNAVAQFSSDGQSTIWVSTQGAFTARDQTAFVLDMSPSKIKVIPAEIGGGFGGKIPIYYEPISLWLSKHTGKPVKMVMSRADVLKATGPTPGSHIKVKMGADKDGKITAAQVWMAYEAGGFPGSPVGAGCMTVIAPYNIDNLQIDGYDVLVNKPKTAAYRAPGATNAAMGSETVIDELAAKLGIDPLEFRRINGAKEGTAQPAGPKFGQIGFLETLEATKTSPHFKSKLPTMDGRKVGRGLASGFWFNAGFQSSATVAINSDGTANVVTGSTDIGGTRTSCAMIAAEVLGLTAEAVHPVVADTESIGHTDMTGGSRVTFATGTAVFDAAHDVLKQLKERAAKSWKVDVDKVTFQDGVFTCAAEGDDAKGNEPMTLKELAGKLPRTGGPVTGRASVNPRGVGPGFATHLVDVAVDEETGKVDVLRYTAVQDVGKAIHPSYVEGQMQGGVAQGVGWALNEEYVYGEDGRMQNTGFLDYRMPTCLDLPMIETVLVEVPNPGHPVGVRGVGEVPIVPPPAAIANAIANATGVRMLELPMSPARVTKAIASK